MTAVRTVVLGMALVFLTVGCVTSQRDVVAQPLIHPLVFEMIPGWISDSSDPVVTEVNLDAVAINRNQFDFQGVNEKEGWIWYYPEDSHGFLRYKAISSKNGSHTVLFQSNGGGTYTSETRITYQIQKREIRIDSDKTVIKTLKLEAIEER